MISADDASQAEMRRVLEDAGVPVTQETLDKLGAIMAHRILETSQRVRELESQLRQSQKMEALGTLAGGIAHDFNNILSAIGGNTELALNAGPSTAVRESLNEINTAFLRAKELVQRILVFSRRQESERKPVVLADVVTEAATLLKATIPRRVEVRVRCASALPMISADATQLHQVVMNLGTNAAHAMADQGGVLAIEVDRVRVDARNAPSLELAPGFYLQLMVRDTGTGINPDIIDRIFDPFFTTKGHGGTGLGLAVVDGIVRDHQGAISVECELGRGTTFRLLFPEAEATDAAPAAAKPTPIRGSGQCIMYVDDEESLVFLMPRLLRSIGYRCTGFADPSAALSAFRADPHGFDAVIADLNMSKMSGLALAKSLVAIRADVPVAIISGEGRDGGALSAEGVKARIHKPATLHELAAVLHQLFHPGEAA